MLFPLSLCDVDGNRRVKNHFTSHSASHSLDPYPVLVTSFTKSKPGPAALAPERRGTQFGLRPLDCRRQNSQPNQATVAIRCPAGLGPLVNAPRIQRGLGLRARSTHGPPSRSWKHEPPVDRGLQRAPRHRRTPRSLCTQSRPGKGGGNKPPARIHLSLPVTSRGGRIVGATGGS
jgi:hypothetical protein